MFFRLFSVFAVILLLSPDCLAQFYGPYDYTNPVDFREKLPIVEQYHFNSDVESLRGTMPGGSMGDHIWYVIRSFPNHHRALVSMEKLWAQYERKGMTPPGMGSDKAPDALYKRAIDFAPQDGVVQLLYGIYLVRKNQKDAAREYFVSADKLEPDNSELQYNLGLMYIKLGDPDQAVIHARRAYAMNYPLDGLRNKLRDLGKWQDNVNEG